MLLRPLSVGARGAAGEAGAAGAAGSDGGVLTVPYTYLYPPFGGYN